MKKILIGICVGISILMIGCLFFLLGKSLEKNIEVIVLPHHNITGKNIDEYYSQLQKDFGNFERIVIISPDHFGALNFPIEGLSEKQEKVCYNNKCVQLLPFGKYANPKSLVSKNNLDTFEHGIGEHIVRIAKFFPDSKVTPILLMRKFAITEMEKNLAKEILSFPEKKILVIASVDFSHHVADKFAKYHDEFAINVLQLGNNNDFAKLEVDCRNCLVVAKEIANMLGKNNFSMSLRTSVDTIIGGNSELENTSHIFGKFITSNENLIKKEIILLLPNFAISENYGKFIQKFYNRYDSSKNPYKFYHRINVGFSDVFVVGEKIFANNSQEEEMKKLGLHVFISHEEFVGKFSQYKNDLDFYDNQKIPILICQKSSENNYCEKLQLEI